MLKVNYRLGVSTAATQIEGGRTDGSWQVWFDEGKVNDSLSPEVACMHKDKVVADAQLLKDAAIKDYRMGIEWARLEPKQGEFDESAIEYYLNEIDTLISMDIEPLVTLHHFNNPTWFDALGGFKVYENVDKFINFAKKMVSVFGSKVKAYVTLNEPNVYAFNGYIFGSWPPAEKSLKSAAIVMSNMAAAHIRLYNEIKQIQPNALVGYADHRRVFDPLKRTPFNLFARKFIENYFQGALTKACLKGEFTYPLKNPDRKIIVNGDYYDYIGLNYYTRSAVKGFGETVMKNAPVNDLGWEIYPEGLTRILDELSLYGKPVFITENGTADSMDKFRARYIYDHLAAIGKSKAKVERYYHWTFYDNFEWVEGASARFGLWENDFATQTRKLRKSGEFYSQIIKRGGVDDELYDKYVASSNYDRPPLTDRSK